MNETRHLGVYGILIKNKNILLVEKSRGAYTGKYDLPGGSIEHGEKPIETLKREFNEEVGINIVDAKIMDANSIVVEWMHHEKLESMHHIGIIYTVVTLDENIKTDADGQDSLGAKWVPISEITRDNVSPLTYEALVNLNYKN